MVISDAVISSRRTAYACCAGDFAVKSREAYQRGDTKKFVKYKRLLKHALWAADLMNRTPLSTEDAAELCVSHDLAYTAIMKFDPLCVRCGCSSDDPAPEPGCDIVPDYTVIGVADAFLGPFDVDGMYLITTDEFFLGDPPIGAIGTAVSGVFTQTGTLAVGEVALDSTTGEYWQGGVAAPWPLFPTFTYLPLFADVIVRSLYPAEQASGTRDVIIEYNTGVAWMVLGTYSEGVLSDPAETIPLIGASTITGMRFRYVIGDCTYGPFTAGTALNPLPTECPVCTVAETDYVAGQPTSNLTNAFVFAIQGSVDPITANYGNQIISTDVGGTVIEQANTGCQDGDYMRTIANDGLGGYITAIYRLDSSTGTGFDLVANLQPTMGSSGSDITWEITSQVDNRAVNLYYSADGGLNWLLIDAVSAGGGSTVPLRSFPAASVPSGDLLFVASYVIGGCSFNSSPVAFNNP